MFQLECQAIKSIVYDLGLDNLILLIPFCSSVDEASKIKSMISFHGFCRATNADDSGIKVYMLCGIPNNVIHIDAFAPFFDGFLIGSGDVYDERNPAVLKLIEMAIEGAKRNQKYVGMCGQLLSNSEEMIHMLIRLGTGSVCVAVHNFMKTWLIVQHCEEIAFG